MIKPHYIPRALFFLSWGVDPAWVAAMFETTTEHLDILQGRRLLSEGRKHQQTTKRKRGPAPMYGENVQPVTISITPSQRAKIELLGGKGGTSAGVRYLLNFYDQHKPDFNS